MANGVLKWACQNQLVANFMNKFVLKWHKIIYIDHLDLENNLLQRKTSSFTKHFSIQLDKLIPSSDRQIRKSKRFFFFFFMKLFCFSDNIVMLLTLRK